LDQAFLHGVEHKLGGSVQSESLHNARAVDGDGIHTDIQESGNFFVRFSLRDQQQDFLFP